MSLRFCLYKDFGGFFTIKTPLGVVNFINSLDSGLDFLKQFFIDILTIESGSVDQHIFADPDPDPGSQNLAHPMDPDPKH